jgi:hypothetical protein
MPKLMPPVYTASGAVALHFSLPGRHLGRLGETARDTQTPRSELLKSFLDRHWDQFRHDHLMEGLTHLRNHCDYLGGLLPVAEGAPEWVNELIQGNRLGDRNVVFVAFLPARWWRRLAEDLHEVEREFMSASLSDVMMLFIAWGWARFEAEWRREREATR